MRAAKLGAVTPQSIPGTRGQREGYHMHIPIASSNDPLHHFDPNPASPIGATLSSATQKEVEH